MNYKLSPSPNYAYRPSSVIIIYINTNNIKNRKTNVCPTVINILNELYTTFIAIYLIKIKKTIYHKILKITFEKNNGIRYIV